MQCKIARDNLEETERTTSIALSISERRETPVERIKGTPHFAISFIKLL